MDIRTEHYSGNAKIGEFILNTSNPSIGTIKSYCTDVGISLARSFNYVPTSMSAATGFAPVWITGGGENAARLWYFDKGAATTGIQTAGMQLAIWELLYNNVLGNYNSSIFSDPSNNGFYVASNDADTIAAEAYAVTILNGFKDLPVDLPPEVVWLAPTMADGQIGGSQGLFYAEPESYAAPDVTWTFGLLGLIVTVLGVMTSKPHQLMMIRWGQIEARIAAAEQQGC